MDLIIKNIKREIMNKDRRDFIKKAGVIASSSAMLGAIGCDTGKNVNINKGDGKMKLTFQKYELKLKHVFTIAKNSRTTTPDMQVQIHYNGITGYGEAAMPPYYPENPDTATKFYQKLDLGQFNDPFQMETILDYVDNVEEGNHFAKASIDIALHDLVGKLMNQPWYKIWGYDKELAPETSFTIGIDKPDVVQEKTLEAAPYKVLKIKLGAGNDKDMIKNVRKIAPDKKLYVDVNGGWKDRQEALDMAHWLKDQNVIFIEQPMPKKQIDDIAWLTQYSPLPIVADESIHRIPDVLASKGVYSGINIKLMKCTGLREAKKMITLARAFDMKILMGCMTATSCSISAAAQLSPAIDWADLDGNLLISNDPYEGVKVVDGKLILPDAPGIGIHKL